MSQPTANQIETAHANLIVAAHRLAEASLLPLDTAEQLFSFGELVADVQAALAERGQAWLAKPDS